MKVAWSYRYVGPESTALRADERSCKILHAISVIIASIALIGLMHAARAQETGSPSSISTTQSGENALEEIVVSATRRQESAEKVPISIVAFSQQDLTVGGIKSIADLSAVTPGLQFTAPTAFTSDLTTVSIRGMNSYTGASTVGIYLDDTPLQARLSVAANVGSPYPVVFDLDRIEVARGPQGTLFGAGSEAGTLRFITNQPSLTNFSGFSHAEVASTENGAPSYEVGVAAGGPIVENEIGFRVSAWTRRDGGYVDLLDPVTESIVQTGVNHADKSAFRAALTFLAGDVRITPSIYYQTIHLGDGDRFYGNFFSNPSEGLFIDGRLQPEVSTDDLSVASVKVETSLPFADLTSTSSFLHRNMLISTLDASPLVGAEFGGYGNPLGPEFATSPSDVAPSPAGQKLQGWTEEVRLASNQPDAFLTWVAGVFYDHRRQEDWQVISSLLVDPTGALIYNIDQHVIDDQLAAYIQGDLHLTQKLTLTLGERVSRVKSDTFVAFGPGFFDVGLPPLTRTVLTETPNTPRVALSYQADANNLYYSSISKGFRPGGGNAALANICDYIPPQTYKSDYDWSYEIGAKNKLFGGRLQIDSSVFHINWMHVQNLLYLPCVQAYTANNGNAHINGVDLGLQALATDRLRLGLNIGYADAYFVGDTYDQSGHPLALNNDKVGLLPQVNSPWNVNGLANYDIPLAAGESLHLRAQYQYTSRNPGPFITQIPTSAIYNPQLAPDPPTHLTSLRASYTRNTTEVALFANNVFNSHPLLSKFNYTPSSDLFTYSTFRPRTLGVSLNVGF
jgi:iron complex outermembrane receptor protein